MNVNQSEVTTEETVDMTTGKDNSNNSNIDDSGEMFMYELPDDDDVNYVDTAVVNKSKEKLRNISLPMILQLVAKEVDTIRLCRILACQILQFFSNSKARTAIQNREFVDLSLAGIACF